MNRLWLIILGVVTVVAALISYVIGERCTCGGAKRTYLDGEKPITRCNRCWDGFERPSGTRPVKAGRHYSI